MREKIVEAIATIDALTHGDIRKATDTELEEYTDSLLEVRALLWDILRTIDSAKNN
jgi:hypothetical protein